MTVFDRNPVPGGMLMLGIPSFRLGKEVVNAEIEILREMGVKFQCGVEVGKDVTIAQLREQGCCGFYVAIGALRRAGTAGACGALQRGSAQDVPRPALHVHGRVGQKGGVPRPWLRREHRRYQPLHRLRRVHDQMRV